MMKLSAESLRERIQGSDELALVDVREGGASVSYTHLTLPTKA